MTITLKAGLAIAAVGLAAGLAGGASAADLNGGWARGSIKDHAPVAGPVGRCYFRGDVGYSWSRDPNVKWPVNNGVWTDGVGGPLDGNVDAGEITYVYAGDTVSDTSLENGWFGGFGAGCGSGSRGLRGEVMFNVHEERKLDGTPLTYTPAPPVGPPVLPTPIDDPLHTSIKTYTLMFNAYHDLGKWGNVTPYVGAGVGVAYNMLSDVYFTGNPALVNRIHGNRDLSLAWSLMAGIGYQISDRAILDFGYRYLDMGKIKSQRSDTGGFVNPAVVIDDIAAHEFKIGLRYHFGSDCCAQPVAYAPMK